ncbi:DUF4178 domain-containing protein [Rhodovulum sp. DZ06]|uniref:DUF4178 domain-containing protein n=1 Tax=Rhodovulum sp. DZ06 TaxID=3425126 RepID=UPI003D34015D
MTRAAEIRSLDCPNCGTGLGLHGGGRVLAMVCPSCGSTLSALEDFQAVGRFLSAERPETPFEIGMAGEIDGVLFTIIGILGMVEREDGEEWRWVDHQLYSPTHGYAWLTVEGAKIQFTRRTRRGADPAWMPPGAPERSVRYRGQQMMLDESAVWEVDYAAGEFSWIPKRGELSRVVSYFRGGKVLTFSESASGEREVELTTPLDAAETCAAFGVEPAKAPRKPRKPRSLGRFIGNTAGISMALCAFAAIVMSGGERDLGRVVDQSPPFSFQLDVPAAGELVRLDLTSNVRNSWAAMGIEVTDDEDEVVFEVERGMEFYEGRDSEGSWTEGSRSASVTFRAPAAGPHTVSIGDFESQVDWSGGTPANRVWVHAWGDVKAVGWLWAAAAVSLLVFLARNWFLVAWMFRGDDD